MKGSVMDKPMLKNAFALIITNHSIAFDVVIQFYIRQQTNAAIIVAGAISHFIIYLL
ncbi:hypothetical protein [Dyadobacter sp. NIV53]|uniref:hypothetical protein n=1 Tax=Dyadobacter sp. NIV53 TaxID=2861765 RepID=UPI001C888FA5|nr:hypothetical protein [Dyadobacter sp. NIV53]